MILVCGKKAASSQCPALAERVECRAESMPRRTFTSADMAKYLWLSIEAARLICADAVNADWLPVALFLQ
ncbi:hypothetical protein DB032_13825 [Chromobacterium sp. Panama]|nr:hypothetical protein DB032_13825 [Chromobacterium sp. Panama]